MNLYYYFLSSLPLLFIDRPASISREQFLSAAQSSLGPDDCMKISEADLEFAGEYSGSNSFLKKWFNRENSIKYYLAVRRKAAADFSYDIPAGIVPDSSFRLFCEKIINEKNPRQAEFMLDYERWQFIDDLANDEFFNINSALAYYLKLQINTRNTDMNGERGEDAYNTIIESYKMKFSSEIFSNT